MEEEAVGYFSWVKVEVPWSKDTATTSKGPNFKMFKTKVKVQMYQQNVACLKYQK